jgi:hypothetical protein
VIQPERAICEIVDGEGQVVGLGFAVRPDLVVTCAHVVNVGLGRQDEKDSTVPSPGETVRVRFPFGGGAGAGTVWRTGVERWGPCRGEFLRNDVAALRLTQPLEASVPRLTLDGRAFKGSVQMYGPTLSQSQRGHVPGTLLGGVEPDLLQVNQELHGIFRVGRGFSGGPVWRTDNHRVVGVLHASNRNSRACDVYVISADIVKALIADIPASRYRSDHHGGGRKRVLVAVAGAVTAVIALLLTMRPPPPPPPTPTELRLQGVAGQGVQEFLNRPEVTDAIESYVTKEAIRTKELPVGGRVRLARTRGVSGREMANLGPELKKYNFAYTANTGVAREIQDQYLSLGVGQDDARLAPVFTSYLVVLVNSAVLPGLRAQKLVEDGTGTDAGRMFFNMPRYLQSIEDEITWGEINRSADTGPFYVDVADPCRSATTELYLAELHHVLDKPSIDPVVAAARKQFSSESAPTTGILRDTFFSGSRRTALSYEHDAFHQLLERPASYVSFSYLYLKPLVPSDHTIVAKDQWGEWVAEALKKDPTLIRLQTEYGFTMNGGRKEVASRVAKRVEDATKKKIAPPPEGPDQKSLPVMRNPLNYKALMGLADRVSPGGCPKPSASSARGSAR